LPYLQHVLRVIDALLGAHVTDVNHALCRLGARSAVCLGKRMLQQKRNPTCWLSDRLRLG
jgi:hypothetical protein